MMFAVLTISDRCSQGLMEDTAGPAVAALLREHWPTADVQRGLLPDDENLITQRLLALSSGSEAAALILTVGGTGLGPRDHTPEATRKVMEREVPGLSEAIRAIGAQANPYAWLSRGVAGLRGQTLIVNLPGSKRGAEESLRSIVRLLAHGLEVVGGGQTHP
jgi:molybdopterin adenylyltransferase